MSLYRGGNDACHPCLVQFPLAISKLSVVLQSPKNTCRWFMVCTYEIGVRPFWNLIYMPQIWGKSFRPRKNVTRIQGILFRPRENVTKI